MGGRRGRLVQAAAADEAGPVVAEQPVTAGERAGPGAAGSYRACAAVDEDDRLPVPRSSYSRSAPLTAARGSMSVTAPGRRRAGQGVGFLGPEQAEGVVDGAVGDPEQDKIVVC